MSQIMDNIEGNGEGPSNVLQDVTNDNGTSTEVNQSFASTNTAADT